MDYSLIDKQISKHMEKQKWVMPEYLEKYRKLIVNTGGNSIEMLMNKTGVTVFNNAPLVLIISGVNCQIALLELLHSTGQLQIENSTPPVENKIRRIFIDLDDYNPDYLETLADLFEMPDAMWNFDLVLQNVGSDMGIETAWSQIKKANEIYCQTSLVHNYITMGSGNLFNLMMYKAIEENIIGKRMYMFSEIGLVHWTELKEDLLAKCFAPGVNELFVQTSIKNDKGNIRYEWLKVDIDELIRKEF